MNKWLKLLEKRLSYGRSLLVLRWDRRRSNIMMRIFFLVISFTVVDCFADPLTNVASLVGLPLTTNEITQLPSRDAASPDTVFLGTIRALRTGNLNDLFYHFETNYLFSLTGYYDPEDIPIEMSTSFQTVMCDAIFSNIVVIAYSVVPSNQFTRVSASLQENYSSRTLTEPITLALRQNTTEWKIIAYDDDKWDE